MTARATLVAVRKSITVQAPLERAFSVFTDRSAPRWTPWMAGPEPRPIRRSRRPAGDPRDLLWWAIKLCRFAPGELDRYDQQIRRRQWQHRIIDT